jgi:hypothetical protein
MHTRRLDVDLEYWVLLLLLLLCPLFPLFG